MLRYRKKYLIGAALAGAALIAVPAAILIAVLLWKNQGLQKQRGQEVVCYQLKKDMESGDLVEENCLKEIHMFVDGLGADPGESMDKGMDKSSGILPASDSIKELCGKRLRISLKAGTVLSKGFLYEGEKRTDDLRKILFSYVISDYVKKNDYVDVRIRYGNGLDFIVLSKKKILDVVSKNEEEPGRKNIWMQLDEEEQLRIACAVVDAYQKKNCSIYAVQYVDEAQEGAIVNYPLSEEILQLMKEDPNILQIAQTYLSKQYRSVIEKLEDRIQDGSLSPTQVTDGESALTQGTSEDEIVYFED